VIPAGHATVALGALGVITNANVDKRPIVASEVRAVNESWRAVAAEPAFAGNRSGLLRDYAIWSPRSTNGSDATYETRACWP
jgi:hypothetical protein